MKIDRREQRMKAELHGGARAALAVVVAWFALGLIAADPAAGQSPAVTGGTNTMTGAGLRLSVDTQWPNGNGYRPVRIEVVPLVPPVADRTLTVELTLQGNWNQTGLIVVGRDIEIPAGSGPIVATLAVPEHFVPGSYDFKVWDDGKFRKTLSFKSGMMTGWYSGWEEGLPNILVVGDVTPDSGA
jgi:hypothetical protein